MNMKNKGFFNIFVLRYMGALLKAVPFAEGDLGIDPVTAAYINSIMGICELVFRIPFGYLGDWDKVNRTVLLGGTFLALGVIFLCFPMCSSIGLKRKTYFFFR